MPKYDKKCKVHVTIAEQNKFWIIVENGKIITKNPTKEELDKVSRIARYNETNICHICRQEKNIIDKSILYPGNALRYKYGWICRIHGSNHQKYDLDNPNNEISTIKDNTKKDHEIENLDKFTDNDINKKYQKGTLGWLKEQQKIKAKKDGFDDIDKWLRWKHRDIEEKYGKDFADWARKNKDIVPQYWMNAGCYTRKEYDDSNSQKFGFKDTSERTKIRRWNRGDNEPAEFNEDCSTWFAEFTENLMIHRYPGAIKMSPNNPGFDYLLGDIKINNKGRCLYYGKDRSPNCAFPISYNNATDIFVLSGWDNRENLNPLFALEFHKNDLVRKGKGGFAPKVEFWKRYTFSVTYPEELWQFEEHQIDLNWLKDILERYENKIK